MLIEIPTGFASFTMETIGNNSVRSREDSGKGKNFGIVKISKQPNQHI